MRATIGSMCHDERSVSFMANIVLSAHGSCGEAAISLHVKMSFGGGHSQMGMSLLPERSTRMEKVG